MTPEGQLRLLVLAAQREGNRLLADQLRPLGLTPSQSEVIRVLHEAQPLSLIELGDLLVCETGSPSRLVDGLVKAGIVERLPSPSDQRKVALSLTKHGQEVHAQVADVEKNFEALFVHIGNEEAIHSILAALWLFVADKPAGEALARRLGRKTDKMQEETK